MKITYSQNTGILLKIFLTEGSRQHCWKLLPAGGLSEQNIFMDCWLGWWRCDRVLESFAVKGLHMLYFLAADTVGIKQKWKLKLCLLTSRNLSFHKGSHWLLIRLLRAGLLYSLPWCFLNETKTNIAAETLRVRSRRLPSGCMSHFKIGARAANRPLEEHTWGRAAAPTAYAVIVPEIHIWVLLLTGSAKMEGI